MEKDLFSGEDNEYINVNDEDNFFIFNNNPQWEAVAQAHLDYFHENDFN